MNTLEQSELTKQAMLLSEQELVWCDARESCLDFAV